MLATDKLARETNALLFRSTNAPFSIPTPSARLKRLQQRWSAGSSTCIRSLGGSVTIGARLAPGEAPFPALLFSLLRGAYPQHHDCDSFGSGGFGSKFYLSCVDAYVPVGCDLVVLDVAVNDISGTEKARHLALDAVVRNLLEPPLSVGGIILMNWYNLWDSPGSKPFRNAGIAEKVAEANGVSTLSMRDWVTLSPRNDSSRFWAADSKHPSQLGHMLIAHALALTLFHGSAASSTPGSASAVAGSTIEGSASDGASGGASDSASDGASGGDVGARRVAIGSARGQVTKAATVRSPSICYTGIRLTDLFVQPLPAGWSLLNEGSRAHSKWGIVAREKGARLRLRLMQNSTREAVGRWADVNIRSGVQKVVKVWEWTNNLFFMELGYLQS